MKLPSNIVTQDAIVLHSVFPSRARAPRIAVLCEKEMSLKKIMKQYDEVSFNSLPYLYLQCKNSKRPIVWILFWTIVNQVRVQDLQFWLTFWYDMHKIFEMKCVDISFCVNISSSTRILAMKFLMRPLSIISVQYSVPTILCPAYSDRCGKCTEYEYHRPRNAGIGRDLAPVSLWHTNIWSF